MQINSAYRDDATLMMKEIFVLDIYQLASQLLPEDDVKSMNIVNILKEVINLLFLSLSLSSLIDCIFYHFSESTHRCRIDGRTNQIEEAY